MIIVPNTLRSSKGKLNYPSIQIVFHLKDLPLPLMIQKELVSVLFQKGVNAYILTILKVYYLLYLYWMVIWKRLRLIIYII